MAKVTFSSLKIKNEENIKKFTFNDKEIEVLQYLPVNEKNNLIEVVLQKANEGSIFNTFTMDMYFHLYLIMYYTNLTFTEKQREDLPKLYDAFEESGFINMFLNSSFIGFSFFSDTR